MWKLELVHSPWLHALSNTSLSPHLSIQYTTDHLERDDFYLYSSHLEVLDFENEADKKEAHYKSEILLLILNTALKLANNVRIYAGDLVYVLEHGVHQKVVKPETDPILHLEQLQNPFRTEAELNSERQLSSVGDIIQLAYEDELFREIVILYALALEIYLYILVNMYKIYENIEYDLKNLQPTIIQNNINLESLNAAMKPYRQRNVNLSNRNRK
ncbi:hypothetical protein Q0F98_40865 [Paenibacillus amylolyticus]|nr:hypothetical protein Q0F98_40865 [Paenibacillus amylolyticus]